MTVQARFALEGGSGTPVPEVSIEVDDHDTALERVDQAHIPIAHGPVGEQLGVRGFYLRDPFGNLVDSLQHI